MKMLLRVSVASALMITAWGCGKDDDKDATKCDTVCDCATSNSSDRAECMNQCSNMGSSSECKSALASNGVSGCDSTCAAFDSTTPGSGGTGSNTGGTGSNTGGTSSNTGGTSSNTGGTGSSTTYSPDCNTICSCVENEISEDYKDCYDACIYVTNASECHTAVSEYGLDGTCGISCDDM